MSGVTRMSLADLSVDVSNSLLIGVIIAKRSCRQISKNDSDMPKAVCSFTFRDSIRHFINVTCWGTVQYIQTLDASFHVGDVVDVIRTQIKARNLGDRNEQYSPEVSSPFSLTFNEGQSQIVMHDGDDCHLYYKLVNMPTKSLAAVFTLADFENNALQMKGNYIDVLVGIRTIGPIKTIMTKDQRQLEARDVIIMDQTHAGKTVTFWEKELIERAAQWVPRKTILFIADGRIDIKKEPCLLISSKTIVTVNPVLKKADELLLHMTNAPIPMSSKYSAVSHLIPDVQSIVNVVSLAHMNQRIITFMDDTTMDKQFTAVVYSFLTFLDFTNCLSTRCGLCTSKIDPQIGACFNLECPAGSGTEQVGPVKAFDMYLTLTDHTSELKNVKLSGVSAERVLGCTPSEFQDMSETEQFDIKWNFLLERCEIKLLLSRGGESRPIVHMLSCVRADIAEVARKLPLY